MRKYDLLWKSRPEWWTFENHIPVVKKEAPIEAQESYQRYLQQMNNENCDNIETTINNY